MTSGSGESVGFAGENAGLAPSRADCYAPPLLPVADSGAIRIAQKIERFRADIVLGLDPSSTAIGYGALTYGLRLVQAGVVSPNHRADSSWDRIMAMHTDLVKLFVSLSPVAIVVEWTKGKVGQRHGGLGAGLAVYGCGVGAAGLAAHLWGLAHPHCQVVPVLENDWTRGIPKRDRQLAIATAYPDYAEHLAEDPGGDISDGIGAADWWIKEQQVSKSLFAGCPSQG